MDTPKRIISIQELTSTDKARVVLFLPDNLQDVPLEKMGIALLAADNVFTGDNVWDGANEFNGVSNFDGATDFDGANVFDGSVTFNSIPLLSGGGVKFPATQVASADVNTLDDYEEGTFTPVIEGTTTAGAGTYTAQLGFYVKVGRQVLIWISTTWTAHTGTGNMIIAGLPFANTSVGAILAVELNNITVTAGSMPTATTLTATTTVLLRQMASATTVASAIPIDTAGTARVSGWYLVAA